MVSVGLGVRVSLCPFAGDRVVRTVKWLRTFANRGHEPSNETPKVQSADNSNLCVSQNVLRSLSCTCFWVPNRLASSVRQAGRDRQTWQYMAAGRPGRPGRRETPSLSLHRSWLKVRDRGTARGSKPC